MSNDGTHPPGFLISRSTASDAYGVWSLNLGSDELLQALQLDPQAHFDRSHSLTAIGGYLLEWGPLTLQQYQPCFPYRLFRFDPTRSDPLNVPPQHSGLWPKDKFWRHRADFGNPDGARKNIDSVERLVLLPLHNFMLNAILTEGRGTFQLWNFDPNPMAGVSQADPLPAAYTSKGSFDGVQSGHELIPLGNYVLDRDETGANYRLWSFDPQAPTPLTQPAIHQGRWEHIGKDHRLVPIGEYVLDWRPNGSYRLWQFDPHSANPLTGPVRAGHLPPGFDADTVLTGLQTLQPVDAAHAKIPGTLDFMRSRIKHVVHLMVENRSFDHVCGWLYNKGETNINFIGNDRPFDGASLEMYNTAPDGTGGLRPVFLKKFQEGRVSEDWDLDFLSQDPYHDKSDVLRQCFHANRNGYAEHARPDMGGFVWNNGVDQVMSTYTPQQLPVLNGLARHFAISDAWFSSMPGPTDPNRAFAFTGSALGELNNFQNGTRYTYWHYTPHRPSIWKVLWSNGFTDWKIYNSAEWQGFTHTYHLFLQSQIPSVDTAIAQQPDSFIEDVEQFKEDARAGRLCAFSVVEPAWIAPVGTTSYHPGADLVPGERALNEIYEALKAGPAWQETLLVITFDEHGGIFDHVPPPYAQNPWPNDVNAGFRYDMMGVRVPTILVSPWIKERTVFRSTTGVPYDSTSFLATLLHWYGIPQARWGLGNRVHNAPTFEGVFQRSTPRTDAPTLTPPSDKSFPSSGGVSQTLPVHDLHRLMTRYLVSSLGADKLSPQEAEQMTEDMLAEARDLADLHARLAGLAKRIG